MILNSFLCIFAYISLIGYGYLANIFLSIKYKSLSSLFILGFILQTLILQIHYIFLPINLKTTFFYITVSLISFIYFKNFSFINLFKNNKILTIIFIIFFVLLQSTSIQYPTNFNIPDFYLYHKNYINWVNNYPVIEGLALLNPRHGYAGITYLNAAYYNFFPIFNNGWAILTPTFILFFLTVFFKELKKVYEIKSDEINLSKIFILLSYYLIFKIILIINKAETSHFLIFTIIALYLFYLLLRLYENFNKKELILIIVISIFLPTILFSLSIYSFFIFLLIVLICYKKDNFLFLEYKKHIIIYSLLIILPFLYLNFLKTGYFFFPVTFFESLINLDTKWSLAPSLGMDLIKGAASYNWAKEKNLSIALITNWPPFYLSLILIPIISLKFFFIKKTKNFINLFLFCTFMVIIWYFSAPEQRYGTPYVWTLLFFEIALILYSFEFKFIKIEKKLIIISCVIILNLSQLIRYYDVVKINFNYDYPKFFIEHYDKILKNNIEYIIVDHEKLLIYNGDSLFVTENLNDFKFIQKNDKPYFEHTRIK